MQWHRGNIREDSLFNELNAHGMAMAGIKVDINPIAEEKKQSKSMKVFRQNACMESKGLVLICRTGMRI